jgi:16S rRNA (uracil1498-N3)-methyltransferase
MPCFYTPSLTIESERITIEGDEFHHITHVFRQKINDTIKLTSGTGVLGEGKILSISKRDLVLEITSISKHQMSTPIISLAFSLLRSKNDEWLVEKLTELGVKRLFPMITTNSVRQASTNVLDRFQKTAISAIKQCENPWLPSIEPIGDLKEIILRLEQQGIKPILASEKEKNIFIPALMYEKDQQFCILIGPEGGFTPEEFAFMEENHVKSFSLGNHILRAETAAIAAVSQLVLQYLLSYTPYH